jgi:hypothetical protein
MVVLRHSSYLYYTGISVARTAFDEAVRAIDTINESEFKDTTAVMQLLRDNVRAWNEKENEDGD